MCQCFSVDTVGTYLRAMDIGVYSFPALEGSSPCRMMPVLLPFWAVQDVFLCARITLRFLLRLILFLLLLLLPPSLYKCPRQPYHADTDTAQTSDESPCEQLRPLLRADCLAFAFPPSLHILLTLSQSRVVRGSGLYTTPSADFARIG